MRNTATMICKTFGVDIGGSNKIKSTVWEDNSGTLKNATKMRITPRTRHISCTYHWFWKHIAEDDGLTLQKVDTTEQLADIATKGLERTTFETIRKLLMGW